MTEQQPPKKEENDLFTEYPVLNQIIQAVQELSEARYALAVHPEILTMVLQQIDKVVKKDYTTKLSVLFTGLSAYMHEPLNLFIRGDSGLGKSYNATKILEFFPEEDVWMLGGMSPTALIHDRGIKMTADGKRFDDIPKPEKPLRSEYENAGNFKEAWKTYRETLDAYRAVERETFNLIELQGKVLVFLESPHLKTFDILRPILSHDKWQMGYRITDKTGSGSLQTKHVMLQGWPATIFLKATDEYAEELATRSFTVSPLRDKEKFKEANQLTTKKANEPWFDDDRKKGIVLIKEVIKLLKKTVEGCDVILPFAGLEEYYPAEIPRDMRDYTHLTQFIKCVTALHALQRLEAHRGKKRYLIASISDVLTAWNLFMAIFENTRTGVSQHLLDFYHQIVEKQNIWRAEELTTKYNETAKPKVSTVTMYKWLKILGQLGYVTWEKSKKINEP
jgi:hypothetical protein